MTEEPMVFGPGGALIGVACRPPAGRFDPSRPALILLNAGLVHRVGPHRLYVETARRLAEQGFVSLRFDFSGIGDSLPRPDHLPYQQSTLIEVREAMDRLGAWLEIEHFCLAGLSSGALVSMAATIDDARVVGAALLNPHGFAESAELGAHVANQSQGRIYTQNLLQLDSWRRLISGKTDYRRLGRALKYRLSPRRDEKIDAAAEKARGELQTFFALPKRILLLLSDQDRSLDNFTEVLGARWRQSLGPHVQTILLENANHTFAGPVHGRQAVDAIEQWMLRNWPGSN
jgi:hypothetical protein